MRHLLLTLLILTMYLLHQDVWFWNDARPLFLGVLPIGLAYHAGYSVAVAGLMWLLVRFAWPALSDVEGPADIEDRR